MVPVRAVLYSPEYSDSKASQLAALLAYRQESDEMDERGFVEVTTMRKVLRGYGKDRNGNLILIGTIPVPHSKDKPSPRERREKAQLVRQGATIFKKEAIR
jgi:hypothetical protein